MSTTNFKANESTSLTATNLTAWDNTTTAGEKIPANVPTNPDGTAHAQALTDDQLRATPIATTVSGVATETTLATTNNKLDSLLTELQLKADLSEAQPVSISSFPPSFNADIAAINATHVASLSAGAGVHAAENTLVGGVYNLTPVTLTDGTQSELNLDNKGNLKVSVENTVPTINIGGVDVNNFPAVQLVAGTLPSVTGNDSDVLLAGDAKQEDFLKVGGYDLGSNEYRIAKFSGDNLQVQVNAGSIAISSGTVTTVTTVGNIAAITPSISAGGFSSHHTLVCAASTNATLVKSTASMIGSISVSNSDVNTFYLKLFNIATAPVVGTTVPAYVYMIPKNTTYNIPIPSYGMRFDAGLSYSTTVNAATADTTAIEAGQAVVNINYV